MTKREKSEQVRLALEAVKATVNVNGWVRVRCPFCVDRTGKEDRRGSLGVNSTNGFFHCFKCDVRGRLEGFDDDDFDIEPVREASEVSLPAEFTLLYDAEGIATRSLAPARKYLRERGLDPRVLAGAGVGACLDGRYAGRVIVPIKNRDGKRVGFSSRAWIKKHPIPYLYPPEMDRAAVLYNERVLFAKRTDPIFVVEGVFDALALWPDSVAVLGKPSEWQADRLCESERMIAIVFDGDAWEEGWSFAQKLRLRGARAGSVILPAKADPDEVDRAQLTKAAILAVETGEAECPAS